MQNENITSAADEPPSQEEMNALLNLADEREDGNEDVTEKLIDTALLESLPSDIN